MEADRESERESKAGGRGREGDSRRWISTRSLQKQREDRREAWTSCTMTAIFSDDGE
jgi:hypothetical protein